MPSRSALRQERRRQVSAAVAATLIVAKALGLTPTLLARTDEVIE
jgi:hypothetical protein